MARLLGDQGEHNEPKVAVFQETADAAAAMAPVRAAPADVSRHVAGPGMAAAVFVAAVKVVMSVHSDRSPPFVGTISIYLDRFDHASVFRYV